MTNMNIVTDQKHVEAVKKAVGNGKKEDRVVYDSFEAARTAFTTAAEIVEKEGLNIPVMAADQGAFFAPELDDDGNVVTDEDGNPVYTSDLREGLNYAVSVVGARARNAEGKIEANGIKAVVFWPMPEVGSFLESENGADWLRKVIEKEAAHVAFRGLRNAESVEEFESAFQRIPTSVEDVIASHVSSGGLDTDAFDTMWAPFRELFKKQQPKLAAHMPPKQDVIRAIRSKPYADQEYGRLEQLGLFAYIGNKLIEAAPTWKDENGEEAPIDASAIQAWLDGRETLDLAPKKLDEAELEGIELKF